MKLVLQIRASYSEINPILIHIPWYLIHIIMSFWELIVQSVKSILSLSDL